jgi:hypothetical protein
MQFRRIRDCTLSHIIRTHAPYIEAKFESHSNSTIKDNIEVEINDKLEVT